jgi:nucleotide-binding universal stress UspA family protein
LLFEEEPVGKSIKRILVAIDGSEHAKKALDVAVDLAARLETELLILHVVSNNPLSEQERALVERHCGDGGAALAPLMETDASLRGLLNREAESAARIRGALGERLLAEAERAARALGAKEVHAILGHGDPARTILSVAKDNGADAIVMGSRGFGELQAFLLGSVALKIAHVAHCTVITVR